MSLATWKAEFYPTEAKDCPADQAIQHSLVKWRGLRPEVLKAHNMFPDSQAYNKIVRDAETFRGQGIDDRSCALCVHHLRDDEGSCTCKGCPLAAARDGYACDHRRARVEDTSPWDSWTSFANPEPMIAALEKALSNKQGSAA